MLRLLTVFTLSFVFLGLGQVSWVSANRERIASLTDGIRVPFWTLNAYLNAEADFWFDLRSVQEENRELSTELLSLKGQYLTVSEELRVCSFQGEQGSRLPLNTQKYIMGRITGMKGNSYLWLNQGASAGLQSGDLVVSLDNLVGWISRVEENRSLVKLISSPDVLLSGIDRDSPTRTKGLVRGDFGLSMVMDNILFESEISISDTIISFISVTDCTSPIPVVLGEVVDIEFASGETIKRATIKSRLNLLGLEEVFVVSGEPCSY